MADHWWRFSGVAKKPDNLAVSRFTPVENVKIMAALKNYRHEKFALALFKGMSQKDAAIQAGYSAKTARQIGSRLLTKIDIVARLQELQSLAASEKIMSVRDRKERLSEIARKGNPNLADPISAIRELNKMDGSYAPEKHLGIEITLTGDDLARIYREARGAFLQTGGEPLGLAPRGGD